MSKKFTHFSLKLLKLSKNKHVRRFLNVYSNPRLTVNKSDYKAKPVLFWVIQYLPCYLKDFHGICGSETGLWIIEGHESVQVKFVYKSWFCIIVRWVPSLSFLHSLFPHKRRLTIQWHQLSPPLGAFSNFFKTLFTWLLSSNERKTNHHVKRTQLPSNWATV